MAAKKPNYYELDINPAYEELTEHYQFPVLPTRLRNPKDKGKSLCWVKSKHREWRPKCGAVPDFRIPQSSMSSSIILFITPIGSPWPVNPQGSWEESKHTAHWCPIFLASVSHVFPMRHGADSQCDFTGIRTFFNWFMLGKKEWNLNAESHVTPWLMWAHD